MCGSDARLGFNHITQKINAEWDPYTRLPACSSQNLQVSLYQSNRHKILPVWDAFTNTSLQRIRVSTRMQERLFDFNPFSVHLHTIDISMVIVTSEYHNVFSKPHDLIGSNSEFHPQVSSCTRARAVLVPTVMKTKPDSSSRWVCKSRHIFQLVLWFSADIEMPRVEVRALPVPDDAVNVISNWDTKCSGPVSGFIMLFQPATWEWIMAKSGTPTGRRYN